MQVTTEQENIELVKRLFDSATNLDANAIDDLLTPDFQMYSNDVNWDFKTFKDYHVENYKTRKSLEIVYHDIFCKNDRVAARVNITLTNLDGGVHEFQVMLIAQIRDQRIYHLWELTFPHWQ